jgi:hypothetical protein
MALPALGTRIIVRSAASSAPTAGPAAHPISAVSEETAGALEAGCGVACASAGGVFPEIASAKTQRTVNAERAAFSLIPLMLADCQAWPGFSLRRLKELSGGK